MTFNIKRFRSHVSSYGYLQSNKHQFIMVPPKVLINDELASSMTETLTFRCDAITTPDTTLATIDTMRYGIGPTQKMPWNVQNNEISVSILCDQYGKIWKYFKEWMQIIMVYSPGENPYVFPDYALEYKDNYVTEAQLNLFSSIGEKQISFNFFDIYPISIKEVELGWEDNNKLIKLIVTMSFKDHTMQALNV